MVARSLFDNKAVLLIVKTGSGVLPLPVFIGSTSIPVERFGFDASPVSQLGRARPKTVNRLFLQGKVQCFQCKLTDLTVDDFTLRFAFHQRDIDVDGFDRIA